MRTPRRLTALAVLTAVTLNACGGDDDAADTAPASDLADDPGASPDSAPDGTDQPPTDPAAGAATITIAGFAFDGVTEVPVGTTVVVTNTDAAQHTWTAVDGAFDSGALGEGDSFEFTFTEPGTYDYRCNFHTSMTGTIVVTG